MQSVEIRRALDSADVAEQAADFILERLLAAKNSFHVTLTGGTVGILTLKHLAQKTELKAVNFNNIHFWFSDERYVAKESPDRNALQARTALLNSLDIPKENIHEMPAADQYPDLVAATDAFNLELERAFLGVEPEFNLTVLGMGPDGHVASLFPGHTYPESLIVSEADSPKPPPQRISMSYQLLNSSKEVLFVVSGVDKAEAIEKVHQDPNCDLPAAKVAARGQTVWIIDQAAGAAFWSC